MRYFPSKIESKWQKRWLKEKTFEPDFKRAKKPFYNLMMFPYPSAEGLHAGNMYAFTGADIYGRFKRMQGFDVFEPIGLDGFGIHSENYAIKAGRHPAKQAKISEKNFYRQLQMIGNGFSWQERLETYDPDYYRWTQWIFVQMFKRGLAYRKKASVNWCPSCKTVLADEQVIAGPARPDDVGRSGGECERCGTRVVRKELEQWFFKITAYAERLLKNLETIDWSEKIKIAQRNWIGKSEGAEIEFKVKNQESGIRNYVLLHGYTGRADKEFIPWLKTSLESKGCKVQAPQMPNTESPREDEQVNYVLKNCKIDENTILVGHSLGGVVAMKVLQKYGKKIRGLVLVAPAVEPKFRTGETRPFWKTFSWNDLDYKKLENLSGFRIILSDLAETKREEYLEYLSQKIKADLFAGNAVREHFTATEEPLILQALAPSIKVFTTRPDTLFGATYIVVAPEHPLIKKLESRIENLEGVNAYIKSAKKKSEEDRIVEGREKTGVELKGIRAINPANKEEIPVWVADYVLGHVGTGAIMAVPAHDQRDFEFAAKYKLPALIVVCPHYPAMTCPVLDRAYVGTGHLVASGKFDGMPSDQAKREIVKFVGGRSVVTHRLRDWLISRQRYWGPPIPMIFCEACRKKGKGEQKDMPGWYAVPEKDLPVKLPMVNDFRPTGGEQSPLAQVEKFYKTRCPKCRSVARRETDVSDTFLDSAWYYLRYLSVRENKRPWAPAIAKKWLPVDMYIGGAEHAVLHLLYVRFLAMAFFDWGLVNFEEPFKKFRAHGLLIKDGAKMSKSKGNVVNPDEYIKAYGADALRMYLMFMGPFEQGGDFRDTGIRGITRFLERVWRVVREQKTENRKQKIGTAEDLNRAIHRTIKKITDDIEGLQYNTAISSLMVLLNAFEGRPQAVSRPGIEIFLRLLAPFAPHITEELWHILGNRRSIHISSWPEADERHLKEETTTLIIQVNGRMRDQMEVPAGAAESLVRELVIQRPKIREWIAGKAVKNFIYVPGRIVNIVA